MECFEVDSKIISYVNHQLEDEDLERVLKHINRCEKCRKEVELFYTLTEGMRQMEGEEITINNFPEAFEKSRKQEQEDIVGRRKVRHYVDFLVLIFVAMIVFLGIMYGFFHIFEYNSQIYSLLF